MERRSILRNWLYPPRCFLCGRLLAKEEDALCADCLREAPRIREPFCKKCGKELRRETEEYCRDCRKIRHHFEYGFALFSYTEEVAGMLARFKYKNRRRYGEWLGAELAHTYGAEIRRMKAAVLVPVPLYRRKERERGFNQAKILAEAIGRGTGILVEDMLFRERSTKAQKELDYEARLANLEGILGVKDEWKGRLPEAVILVDDIYTTGSTIEACTAVLKKNGVRRVYFLAAAIGVCG